LITGFEFSPQRLEKLSGKWNNFYSINNGASFSQWGNGNSLVEIIDYHFSKMEN
jgi:hypothetical protein